MTDTKQYVDELNEAKSRFKSSANIFVEDPTEANFTALKLNAATVILYEKRLFEAKVENSRERFAKRRKDEVVK
jgi:hypothetical protein